MTEKLEYNQVLNDESIFWRKSKSFLHEGVPFLDDQESYFGVDDEDDDDDDDEVDEDEDDDDEVDEDDDDDEDDEVDEVDEDDEVDEADNRKHKFLINYKNGNN